jgi:hypothetical protein
MRQVSAGTRARAKRELDQGRNERREKRERSGEAGWPACGWSSLAAVEEEERKIHGLLPAAAEKNERACVFMVSEEIGLWGVGGWPRPLASLAGPC